MSFQIKIKEKNYLNKHDNKKIIALKNINIEMKPDEFVCIVGPSGCGKTTLMNIIGGLVSADEQSITLNKEELSEKNNLGYVFQTSRLLPWLTLKENVKLVCKEDSEEIDQKIASFMRNFDLKDFINAYPNSISGGMRRKVALVRAFINNPDILLMDEPFISLDQPTSENLYKTLIDHWKKNPTTIVLITHNLKEALLLGDRILFFSKRPGTVVYDYKVKSGRSSIKIDNEEITEEYNQLKERYPTILKGLL